MMPIRFASHCNFRFVQSRRTRRALLLAAAVATPFAAHADPLNPSAFTPLGTLELNTGSITINTDTMSITGAATFSGVSQPQPGATSIAVFDFSQIALASNVSVTVTGSHPLALLSTGNIVIDNTINMDAGIGQTSPGPGAGGIGDGPGGGGGFGGAGGSGDNSGPPGQPYANLTQFLQAGSDGGDAAFNSADGGRGGGAIELSALDQVLIAGTLSLNGGTGFDNFTSAVSSGSGSGGGILISGAQGVDLTSAHLSASGAAGKASVTGAGGGGGGGAIAIVGANATFNPQNFSSAISAAIGTINGGAAGTDQIGSSGPGQAGVFTIVPPTTTLTTSQSYSGPLLARAASGSLTPAIDVQLGNLILNSTATLSQGCDQLIVPGSSLDNEGFYSLGGYAQTVGTLSGAGTIDLRNGSRLTVNLPAGNSTFTGAIINSSISPGGAGSLIKTGAGELILSGSNTYSGGTTINAGTLLVQSTTTSPTGTGSVTINSGATLAGTGTLSSDIYVLPGGTLSPGTTSAGSLTVANLVLAGGSYNPRLGGTAANKNATLNVANNATLGGSITVGNLNSFTPLPGESFQIMTFASASGTIDSIINQTTRPGLYFTPTLSATTLTLTAAGIPGDANLNGTVGSSDFALLAAHYGQTNQTWLTGDFNGDGTVNALDFNALATNYGDTLSQSAAPASAAVGSFVPEPASIGIFAIATLLCRRRSQHRSRHRQSPHDSRQQRMLAQFPIRRRV